MQQNTLFLAALFTIGLLTMAASFAKAEDVAKPSGGLTVVELFTSQGCSSCPPADEVLGQLVKKYPDNVLALSYHVDYWNYIGWQDPFSKSTFSDYQRDYAAVWNSRRVYTPQMIINGRHDVVGSQKNNVLSALVKAKNETSPLHIDIADQTENGTLKLNISSNSELAGANILLVTYTPTHTTQVKRGENRGRSLTNYNIVRSVEKMGAYNGKHQQLTVAKPNEYAGAVLLQDPKTMQILAAATL